MWVHSRQRSQLTALLLLLTPFEHVTQGYLGGPGLLDTSPDSSNTTVFIKLLALTVLLLLCFDLDPCRENSVGDNKFVINFSFPNSFFVAVAHVTIHSPVKQLVSS